MHCTPSKKNTQNRLVHHLIGTKLRCALPECMLVQNYILNLDLHVRCQPQKYYNIIMEIVIRKELSLN